MQILLVSDLHGQRSVLSDLEKAIKKEKPQAVICAGDFTSFDETDFVKKIFDLVSRLKVPFYAIWGNCDRSNVRKLIGSSPYCIHLKTAKVGGVRIFGISDTEEVALINPKDVARAILVTHRPPHLSILRKKFDNAPAYHICGHIHNIARQTDFPSTRLIQVPSLTLGRYALLDTAEHLTRFKQI